MHSSAEHASKLTPGVGPGITFFGMAFLELLLGLSFCWECFLQGRGFAFGRVHTAPNWVCWFAPACWLSQPVLINFAPRAPLCWDLVGSCTGMFPVGTGRGTRAAPVLSCPSHQQRQFGIFKAKVDFSLKKKKKQQTLLDPLPPSVLAF